VFVTRVETPADAVNGKFGPLSTVDVLPPPYAELERRVRAAAERQPGLRALTYGGSLARGEADAYSDLDLLAIVDDPAAFDAEAVVREATETVLLRRLPFGVVAVTPDWLRLDLVVRAADAPERAAEPPDVRGLAEEFLRVLGLLPAVAGRGEWIVGSDGVWLLRLLLVQLCLASNGETAVTGVKRLNAKLTSEQRSDIEALPPVAAARDAVIEGHLAVARAFLPRARAMVDDWPAPLEDATREHLRRELDLLLP
jgi:predicted nucleotidyltransferase